MTSLELLKKAGVKSPPQHQGSLMDQLRELNEVANYLGLYDASDFLSNIAWEEKKKRR
jgi:hypothetical protein